MNSTTDPLPYACAIILVYTVHYIAVGGKLENSWSPSCTHLVMSALTVTVKVSMYMCLYKGESVCMCVSLYGGGGGGGGGGGRYIHNIM